VAVAALLLWLCTATIGSYLLVTAVRAGNRDHDADHAESVSVPAGQPAAAASPTPTPAQAAAPAPVRNKDIFAPQSLRQAQSEPIAGVRDVAEFSHPALALIGFGFWLGYVVSRDRLFAVIGLGILLAAICAGLSWYFMNKRDIRRAAATEPGTTGPGTTGPGTTGNVAPRLTASPRVLILHGAGAALTLLIAVLIAARV
jgi:hypothetical protein